MIESISIKNFKSLRDVNLKLGPLNVFIGTNASGKSNFFDALRVLQGIGNGFTIGEIVDGKPKSATSEVWGGIRGGSNLISTAGSGSDEIKIAGIFDTPWLSSPEHLNEYGISLSSGRLSVTSEWLCVQRPNEEWKSLFDSRRIEQTDALKLFAKYRSRGEPQEDICAFNSEVSLLSQLTGGDAENGFRPWIPDVSWARGLSRRLADMQRVDPSPKILADYSNAHQVRRMGEYGENFAALVRTIISDPESKDAYLTWLRHLRPAEVDDVGILTGAVGEAMFMLKEGGKEFPAPVLSDGTLRFAAITAAFFQPDMPGIMTIEEIENGIHASRLRLLVELLKNRAAEGRSQIMVTTHSPVILDWLDEKDYAHVFFCKRDEETGESRIVPLTEIPHFMEAVKTEAVGDLFAEGWMEAAL